MYRSGSLNIPAFGFTLVQKHMYSMVVHFDTISEQLDSISWLAVNTLPADLSILVSEINWHLQGVEKGGMRGENS